MCVSMISMILMMIVIIVHILIITIIYNTRHSLPAAQLAARGGSRAAFKVEDMLCSFQSSVQLFSFLSGKHGPSPREI